MTNVETQKWHGAHLSREPYLQVPVDDPHVVEVLHRIQNLVDELAGVSLRVEALLHDPVEQLAARHAAREGRDVG